VREISRVAVVGRREPVVVYEPYLPEALDEGKQSVIRRFSEAVALFYRGDFTEALARFESLEEDDATSRFYVAKCRELIEHPPADWQGVWIITSK